jgi:hypothetical protein
VRNVCDVDRALDGLVEKYGDAVVAREQASPSR